MTLRSKTAAATRIALTAAVALAALPAFAQQPGRGPGQGPVATECKEDIAKHCAGIPHEGGAVRACLEGKKTEVTQACRMALETTGPGRGQKQ